jgi:photosystem II stability/assembly factor-like uncharacterized protein
MLHLFRRVRRSSALLPAAVCAAVSAGLPLASAAAGPSFHRLAPLPGLGSGRVWDVAADPAFPATLLAATDDGVYRSLNFGGSWSLALRSQRAWVVGFDVRNSSDAFVGTDGGGIFASSDAGQSWVQASDGLPNLDVRCLAFGLDGVAAGTDSGVALSPDGRHWHAGGLNGLSISALTVAANSPQFTLIAGADNGTLSGGYLFRGTGGSAWTALSNGLPSGAVVSSLTSGPIDVAVPKRPLLVATTKGLFRSGDSGTTWTASSGIPSALGITDVAFSPLDPTLAYAGADAGGSTGGDLLRSTDGGQTFSPDDSGLPATSKNIEAIGFGQTDPLAVAVAYDPPSGTAGVYLELDTTAPTPPQLLAESPGAPVPTVVATPAPTPTPPPVVSTIPSTPAPPNGALQVLSTIFHWPVPLVYEVILLLLIVYGVIRWRQHYYIEGPP